MAFASASRLCTTSSCSSRGPSAAGSASRGGGATTTPSSVIPVRWSVTRPITSGAAPPAFSSHPARVISPGADSAGTISNASSSVACKERAARPTWPPDASRCRRTVCSGTCAKRSASWPSRRSNSDRGSSPQVGAGGAPCTSVAVAASSSTCTAASSAPASASSRSASRVAASASCRLRRSSADAVRTRPREGSPPDPEAGGSLTAAQSVSSAQAWSRRLSQSCSAVAAWSASKPIDRSCSTISPDRAAAASASRCRVVAAATAAGDGAGAGPAAAGGGGAPVI